MANAGYSTVVSLSSDDVSYSIFDGIKNFSGALAADELDTTDFADTQWRTRIQGLKSGDFSLEGDYEPSDTAQTLIRTACTSGATVYLKVLFDGTNGYKVAVKVMSYEPGAAVDGLATVSASFLSNAAPTFLP